MGTYQHANDRDEKGNLHHPVEDKEYAADHLARRDAHRIT